MQNEPKLGISGAVAKQFLTTQITPLLALVGLLLGIFAIAITPREEDPQVNVTFANVLIPFPGASAKEVELLVSTPAEQVLSEIKGIKHTYSTSMPGLAIVTVQFKVGEDRSEALVRLYNQVASNQDWLPANLGVMTPLVKPKGIDDVPIITLTLWSKDETVGSFELKQVAHAIESELKREHGTRNIYTIGGTDHVVHVEFDATKLAGYNIAIDDLRNSLRASNAARDAVSLISDNTETQVVAGTYLTSEDDVANLVVGVHNGNPVYLRDVATITRGADSPDTYVSFGTGGGANGIDLTPGVRSPAVTVAIAKQPGSNAVDIAEETIERFEKLRGAFVPEGVEVTVTRNYGHTAQVKSDQLIKKLIIETIAVSILIWLALGWREAFIVGTAIVVTLAITLFASWAYGFTLNRVSLFALIFSLGILVDDAIVVVENIHRHMQQGGQKLLDVIPKAVDEVGGPTILATFTVIAALLPMAFVTGLMGPYMSPIPINASLGMLISLAVAYVVTPWMTNKVLGKVEFHAHEEKSGWLDKLFKTLLSPFLDDKKGGIRQILLFGTICLVIALSLSLAAFKVVVLKMLPFDDKSELQVVLDMPEGTSLEQTSRVLNEMSDYLSTIDSVHDYQIYAGTAAPVNFNGLVRQYYLREGNNVGDIQVNLVGKADRDERSHDIALDMRPHLQKIAEKYNASVKVAEVPPGPPVQSPIVAEIYGLGYENQISLAKSIREEFEKTDNIVDVDDSVETMQKRLVVKVDQQKAALLSVSQQVIVQAIDTALRGEDVVFLHGRAMKYAVPVRLEFPVEAKDSMDSLLALKVRSQKGALISLSELVTVQETQREHSIYHKDLLPVVYVTGDMAGDTDSPLYGMFDIFSNVKDMPAVHGKEIEQHFISQPDDPYFLSLKWDGEWQITYETFRDMGIAYSVGMLLIYLLIVAQFHSYMVPLVIMAPIPLTVIGVLPGHALLGAQFTATSMIGMIALAGIIVRNSILLVDFINEQVRGGMALKEAIINASTVRAKPIALTGVAAVLGALFIIDDPIFGGLAISLIFGVVVSTLLTLVLIPLLYYSYIKNRVDTLLIAEDVK